MIENLIWGLQWLLVPILLLCYLKTQGRWERCLISGGFMTQGFPQIWRSVGSSQQITESQNGRVSKGLLEIIWSNPPAKAGSPRPHPGGVWMSPEKETSQPPWAAWARAPSPSEGRSSSSCSDGTSCASVCADCPLSCHWAPLKRDWPHPLDTHPL